MNTAKHIYRRKFLTFAAATAASLGIAVRSFGSSVGAVGPIPAEDDGNVRRFGAVGDGKTDDTEAIRKAIHSGGGSIYFPKGSYRITKTLTLDLDKIGYSRVHGDGASEIIMAGAGPAFKITGTHFKSADPYNFSADVWQRQRMPAIDNLAIKGAHPESIGIEATGTMQLTVSRIHVRNVLHCIHLTGNNRNLIISDCHLYENRGIGVYYDDVNLHQSNIIGCHISYNDGGGVVSRGGNVRNIQITGCDIESNMGKDGAATANVLIDCSSSQWGTAEVAITGCTIQHNNQSPESANIRILGRNKAGSSPSERWGNVTITGNILSDVMVNVHLKDCRGVAISGNTFWEGFDHNLLLEGCGNIVMGANVFDYNGNYERKMKAKNSVVVSNCEDCTLSGIHITNAKDSAGLLVEDSRRMNITNCTILDCANTGMMLKNVSESIVSGCLIRNNKGDTNFTPLKTVGGQGNLISNNLLV